MEPSSQLTGGSTRDADSPGPVEAGSGTGQAPTETALDEGVRVQLQEIARAASSRGNDLETVGPYVLECLLELLDFERAFLLARQVESPSKQESAESEGCEVLSVRVGGQSAEGGGGPAPRQAAQTLLPSVVERGFAAPDSLLVEAARHPADEAGVIGQRTVLARALPLSAEVRGLIYLERQSDEPVGALQQQMMQCLVDWCTPVLGKAWLWRELLESRRRLGRCERDAASEEPEEPVDERGEVTLIPVDELPPDYHGLIGRDEKLAKIIEISEKVKDSDLNICIFGESGTGKELVARAIHAAGSRRDRAFVSENCGAISETLLESELFGHVKGAFTGAEEDRQGLFELADGGTLFLDEIGDMSEGMQRKLLRALQEGVIRPIGSKANVRVDVRVVCASNRDLKHLVQKGEFRADLYYRLNVLSIQVPPLRDRRGDVPLLISHFVAEIQEEEGIRKRFSSSALRALYQYGWPGNVRELRNVLRRVLLTSSRRVIARKDVQQFLTGGAQGAAILGENVEREDEHLILRIPFRPTFNEIIDECERLVLWNALKEHGWNKSRVTQALKIPRQSLYNKIAKHDLKKPVKAEQPG